MLERMLRFWSFRSREQPAQPPVEREIKKLSEAAPKGVMGLIRKIGLAFVQAGSGRAGSFDQPSTDLIEVALAYQTDGYFRQAIGKYVTWVFKAGHKLVGKNSKSVGYIEARLKLMEELTGEPFPVLLRGVARDMIKYGNAFLVKNRKASGTVKLPGITMKGITGTDPVLAYERLNPWTIRIQRDINGRVTGYRQEAIDENGSRYGEPKDFKVTEILHFPLEQEAGYIFGTTFTTPALDDIRLLRQVEENVAKLLHKDLFPLIHVKVGSNEQPADQPEVEQVVAEIQNLPMDGALVTDNRKSIEQVTRGDTIIPADKYLEYFRQRVFTDLGVSSVLMGNGDTSNRSTAQTLDVQFQDTVKEIQQVLSVYINFHIVRELLMEGGFDPLVKPDDVVLFHFNEVDLETKIKLENHAAFKFEHNLQTFDESRLEMGHDPNPDLNRLYTNFIKIPEMQASIDAKAAGNNTNDTNNRNQPANQYGKRTSPKIRQSNSDQDLLEGDTATYRTQLLYHWNLARQDVVDLLQQYYSTEKRELIDFQASEVTGILYLTRQSWIEIAPKYLRSDQSKQLAARLNLHTSLFDKVIADLKQLLTIALREAQLQNAISMATGAFRALEYRISEIAKIQ